MIMLDSISTSPAGGHTTGPDVPNIRPPLASFLLVMVAQR
jgi:hypothetical protein